MNHLAAVYYLIDIAGAVLAVGIGWATARLFKTKTIKEIVQTANDTINLYEKRENALEGKIDEQKVMIDDLVSKVATLQTSLDKALAQNELLQALLLKAGEGSVTLPQRVSNDGPNEHPQS